MGATISIPDSSKLQRTYGMSIRHPIDPYRKNGNRKSCLMPAMLSPVSAGKFSNSSSGQFPASNMTVLMQLILLKDWQRVLIRSRLFGDEVSTKCVMELFPDVAFRVLPIHVACALNPPPQVIEALLKQPLGRIDLTKRKKNKRDKYPRRVSLDDEEETARNVAVDEALLSLAAVPVEYIGSGNRKKKKASKQRRRLSWSKTRKASFRTHESQSRFKQSQDDQEGLLDRDETDLVNSHLASNRSESYGDDIYVSNVFESEASPIMADQDSVCVLSLENSIGDIATLEDHVFSITDNSSSGSLGTDAPIFEDDWTQDGGDEVEVVAGESSQLSKFLEKEGVVLQLTATGDIQPLPLPTQEARAASFKQCEFTAIELPHSLATSSNVCAFSQYSSTLSASDDSKVSNITLSTSEILDAFDEHGCGQLLALHIACLYQAPTSTLRLLLKAFPEGAMTGFLGMLPVHLIAANWMVPEFQFVTKAHSMQRNHAQHPAMEELHASMVNPQNENGNMISLQKEAKNDRIEALIDSSPETLFARSGLHNLRPLEYMRLVLHLQNNNDVEEYSVSFLERKEKEYTLIATRPITCSSNLKSATNELLSDRTQSHTTVTTTASSLSGMIERTPPPLPSFGELLQLGHFNEAMSQLELDYSLAKEWHYGIDKQNSFMNDPCTLWKRLPLHIICANVKSMDSTIMSQPPIGLIKLLIRIYPEGLRAVDPHTGFIPLHLACRSCSIQSMSSAMLQFIRLALKTYPHSTKAVDAAGRLPIHHAVMVGAPHAIVELLVNQDPHSVLCPDKDGKTPLMCAQKVYRAADPVMGLLELAWL